MMSAPDWNRANDIRRRTGVSRRTEEFKRNVKIAEEIIVPV